MSVDSVSPGTNVAGGKVLPVPPCRRGRLPRRFFVGTLALYALVLGTFLLSRSALQHARPDVPTIVPTLAGVSFYIAGSLFLLILGRGEVSRWVVLIAVLSTFVLATALDLVLRSRMLYKAMDPSHPQLRHVIDMIADGVEMLLSGKSWVAESLKFIGMIVAEEAVKLLPIFLLIYFRKVRNAHSAMLCGALAGLMFGALEAVTLGYLEYPPNSPVTIYLTRFFIMSPLHGMWDALACGLVFFLSGRWRSNAMRQPGFGAYAAAFGCAVIFHVAHNALQTPPLGAKMQVAMPFALLAPLYVMAKMARRRAALAGGPPEDDTVLVGDLHIMTISVATLLLGASVTFSWAMGISAQPQNTPASASAAAR